MLIQQAQVGDALAWLKHQSGWRRSLTFPVTTLRRAFDPVEAGFPRGLHGKFMTVLEASFASAGLVLALFAVGRMRPALWLFAVLSLLVSLSSGTVLAMIRHTAVLFPIPLYLADVTEGRPLARATLLFASAMLLPLLCLRYMNWLWVG